MNSTKRNMRARRQIEEEIHWRKVVKGGQREDDGGR